MKQGILTRLDKLKVKIGAGDGPRCLCTMKDGKKKLMNGYTIIGYKVQHPGDFIPPDIVDIKTDDPNFYNFFGNLIKSHCTISLVPRIL